MNRFLNRDREIWIDDDDTYGNMNKYLVIKKEDFNIKFVFKNLLSEEEYYPEERFRVFIKNIGPDARSKIDDYNFKCRIIDFLRDCETTLLEEYHQITIDEYIETLQYLQGQQNNKIKKLI